MSTPCFTIDSLIAELERQRAQHGGSCQIGIDDGDTGWELPIVEIRFNTATQRVLLAGDYYRDEFPKPVSQ